VNKSRFRIAALIAFAIAAVYGMIYVDVWIRAKESYLEAEKYLDWSQHPEHKQAYFDAQFSADKEKLEQLHARHKISDEDYQRKLNSLVFDKNFHMGESSLKYAYQWYKDTYELFSPPESRWTKEARLKAPEALVLWKQELRAKNVPFDDFMFQ
jgi:hypothetical protein